MKRGLMFFLLLLPLISISFASAYTMNATQNAASIVLNVGGIVVSMESEPANFVGVHSYFPAGSVPIGGHDASQVLVSVQDGETNLTNALTDTTNFAHKLCPNPAKPTTYSAAKPNPGHYATEVILSNFKTLQQAINDGDFCGCNPGDVKKCGVDPTCFTYPSVTCLGSGTWPSCPIPTVFTARGTACSTSNDLTANWHSCNGAGVCEGYSGTGCSGCPWGTTYYPMSGGYYYLCAYKSGYQSEIADQGVWNHDYNTPYYSWSCHNGAPCGSFSGICTCSGADCSSHDDTWYIKPY